MSGVVNAFEEFKQTSKINNVIIDWGRKNNEMILYVYCIEKDINILNEKNRLLNLCCKHGVSWRGGGKHMGSSPQTNPNFISTSHVHLHLYFYFQEEKDKFFFFHCIEYL